VGAQDRKRESGGDSGDASWIATRDCTDGDPDTFLRGIARAPELALAWTPVDGEVGRTIAERFRVRRCLGAGGMGVVYEVDDEERQERVAIKTLRVLDAEGLYRFKSEFRSLVDVLHPNLVRLSELLCDGGKWFFTMELIDGTDFLSYLHAHPGDLSNACLQLVDGLAAIHRAGKIHRDIKPSNVLVTAEGRVVVLDFGLVSGAAKLEGDGAGVGTPTYMAPEQAAGGDVGPAADVYALGALLYQALTGEAPFAEQESAAAIMALKQVAPAPRPSAKRRDVPASLDDLCAVLLARDPAHRPTLVEARRVLEEALGGDGASPRSARHHPDGGEAPRRFIGRGAELETLEASFRQPRGEPITWLVCGESGIGKTALAREWAERVERQHHALVLHGRCYEQEHVPHKAFDSLVDALVSQLRALPHDQVERARPPERELGALVRLFPVLARVPSFAGRAAPDHAEPNELRRTAYAALRALLSALDARQRLILIIDDLQWTDADSLILLRELLRPPGAPPLVLVATLRPEHPELGFPGTVRRIDLAGLDPAEAARLAELSGRTREEAAAIAAESLGHPLFTQALADAGADSFTSRLPELLRARRAARTAPAQRLLDAIAVAGVPIRERVAANAAKVAPAELWERLAELRAARLIRSVAGLGIEVYHDRIREAALGELDERRRRGLHAALAGALEDDGAGHQAPGLLMRHLQAAGDTRRAAPYAERAAEQALRALAFDEAAALYADAIRLYGVEAARELHALRASALGHAGRTAEAGAAYLHAAEGATAARAIALQQEAARCYLTTGHLDEGHHIMRRILATIGEPWPESALGAAARTLAGRVLVARRGLGFEPRDESTIDPQELLRVDVYFGLAGTLIPIDFMRGAVFHTKAIRLALDLGERRRIEGILLAEASAVAARGKKGRPAADKVCALLERLATESGRPSARGLAAQARVAAAYLTCDFNEVVAIAPRAERLLLEAHDIPMRMIALNHARFWRFAALQHLGAFHEMNADDYLRDALRRQDRFAEGALRLGLAIGWLARGGADLLRSHIEALSWQPSAEKRNVFNSYRVWAGAALALYQQDPQSADWEPQLRGESRRQRRLMLPSMSIQTDVLWGRAALVHGGAWRVERIAARLAREGVPIASAWAELLRAALALDQRGRAAACECLRRASRHARAAGSPAYQAVARARLAELERDPRRRACALDDLAATGVAEPERFVAFVAPGRYA
jgi:hypothetical protein